MTFGDHNLLGRVSSLPRTVARYPWCAEAFYKLPAATTHLNEQPIAAYVAAASAYSHEASPQPPPAGSALPVDHAPAA